MNNFPEALDSPLKVPFYITGTPEQLCNVKGILEPHSINVEMLDPEDFEYD